MANSGKRVVAIELYLNRTKLYDPARWPGTAQPQSYQGLDPGPCRP